MEEKLVSIITPCYNGETYLDRFFNNILEQTYKNIELIFINDGSKDRTEEIAMSYKQRVEACKHSFIYIYQENAGQAAAVNKGIKIFSGDYLIWTDADDILHKDNVKVKVEFMENNLEYGIAQCYGKEVMESDLNKKIRDFKRVPPMGEDNFFEDLIMKRNVEYTPGLFIVRRSAFLEANPNLDIYEGRTGQNMQMLLPIVYHFKCGYIKEDLFTYVIRNESHSHDDITTDEFIRRSHQSKKTTIETLNRINMTDRDYYINKAEEKIIRDQFNAGYAFKDNDLIKVAFKELRDNSYLTKRDVIVYYAFRYKVINFIFLVLKKTKAIMKMIMNRLR